MDCAIKMRLFSDHVKASLSRIRATGATLITREMMENILIEAGNIPA